MVGGVEASMWGYSSRVWEFRKASFPQQPTMMYVLNRHIAAVRRDGNLLRLVDGK